MTTSQSADKGAEVLFILGAFVALVGVFHIGYALSGSVVLAAGVTLVALGFLIMFLALFAVIDTQNQKRAAARRRDVERMRPTPRQRTH